MKLCYLDESGNTGSNLLDPQQPYFILSGIIVDSTQWRVINDEIAVVVNDAKSLFKTDVLDSIQTNDSCCRYWSKRLLKSTFTWSNSSLIEHNRLKVAMRRFFKDEFEIHSSELFTGNRNSKGVQYANRLQIIDGMIEVLVNHQLPIIYVIIYKQRHAAKYKHPEPPEELAFMFFIEQFEEYLETLEGDKTGLIISDKTGWEEKFKLDLLEYQQNATKYYFSKQISNVIDTIHFVDSKDSYCVQASDVVTYLILRKKRGDSRWDAQYQRMSPSIIKRRGFPQ